HIVVTGGNGYIGSRLAFLLRARGARVTVFSRSEGGWALGRSVPVDAFNGIDAIVHLAHQWTGQGPVETDINVVGTRQLLDAARRAGVRRFVFASSVAARPDALNRYGRIKHAIERTLSGPNEITARVGMVYGGRSASQWGTLLRLSQLPVLPMLEPKKAVQPIHLDDLCEGLIQLVLRPSLTRTVYGLCVAQPTTLDAVLRVIARIKHGSNLWIFPIPARLALMLVDVIACIPGLPRVDRERILGIMGLPTVDSAADLRELGIEPRSLDVGLALDARERRRRLLVESRILLAAVVGAAPPGGSMRRYVHAIERFGDGHAIDLPFFAAYAPTWLAAYEPIRCSSKPLVRRLALAVRVATASPIGAKHCYCYAERGILAAVLSLGLVAVREALLLPLRLMLGRIR
ncbi:MAG: NAD-dependent epimerase/dehydratase family protein, partial [Acidimicrobiia bacterium]|nr:NAD-dependent epimerase/dehydratase family protein [Acidimicrobiia bacterium]